MIKAVIFDFDGLMVDTESVWYDVYAHLFKQDGALLTVEKFSECVGTTNETLYALYEREVGKALDVPNFQQRARSHFEKVMDQPVLRDGVRDYLHEGTDMGFKIGLATSSRREWVERFLKYFNLIGFFETIVTRDDVTKVKPDPELYEKAVRNLGIEAHEAVAFEDSAHGATAAVTAGLHCVVVPNRVTRHLGFPSRSVTLESMSDCSMREAILRVQKFSSS